MSYFFPPEVMGAHIGPAECHSTNRRHAINMRGVTALSGHMGVELDPVKESPEEKQAFATTFNCTSNTAICCIPAARSVSIPPTGTRTFTGSKTATKC